MQRAAMPARLLAGVAITSLLSFPVISAICSPSRTSTPGQGEGVEATATVATDQKLFTFRSGFWINLHHYLYLQAVLASSVARHGNAEAAAQAASPVPRMDAAQRAVWDRALEFYKQYGGRDALRDRELIGINYELSDAGNSPSLAGRRLPPGMANTLQNVAPIYRTLLWRQHDEVNRKWIDTEAKLLRQYGPQISKRLSTIYRVAWPSETYTVEVVEYANWAGAYTVLNSPLITISSTDSAGQGTAGLEDLFHEASHVLAAQVVQPKLEADMRASGKTAVFDMTHVMIFYTAGVVTKGALVPDDARDFVPYAIKNGLYDRVPNWTHYRAVYERDWQTYLDGKISLDEALKQIAKDM